MSLHSYVVTSAADTTGHGTLRSAILFANAHAGTTITFAQKLAHHTITLSQEHPRQRYDHQRQRRTAPHHQRRR